MQEDLQGTLVEVQKMRAAIKRELEMARQMREQAEKYRRETETAARSQAQLLVLQARLATQKEISELKQKANDEIQRVLTDIRMVRITAQEELEIQRRFASIARIKALSPGLEESQDKSSGGKPSLETAFSA